MTVILTNQEVPADVWKLFTKEQLRALAKKHGIMTGCGRHDLVHLLKMGAQYHTEDRIVFNVEITLKEL